MSINFQTINFLLSQSAYSLSLLLKEHSLHAKLIGALFFKRQKITLKIVKSATSYTETAIDEIKLLKRVPKCLCQWSTKNNKQTNLLSFASKKTRCDPPIRRTSTAIKSYSWSTISHHRHGTHVCWFPVLGANLMKLIIDSHYEGIPLQNVKSITKQVLECLDYLHSKAHIFYIDLK